MLSGQLVFVAELLRLNGVEISEPGSPIYFDVVCDGPARVSVEARPSYCNRGRFMVNADTTDPAVLTIDWADGFPRYYFGVEACVSELIAWMRARDLLAVTR